MNTHAILLGALAAASADPLLAQTAREPVDWVDTRIGCSYNGHCTVAVARPFGLVQAGPDTGFAWWDYCGGYRYADTRILGFSQTHLSGSGDGELGDLLIMPFTGAVDLTRTNYASAYRKETQTARPGYYAVTLDENHARVEIAATKRCALYRIGYLGPAPRRLLIDLQHGMLGWGRRARAENRVRAARVVREGDRGLAGWIDVQCWGDTTRRFNFVLEFDRPLADWTELPKRHPAEKGPRFVAGFAPGTEELNVTIGVSAQSVGGARRNLATEARGVRFGDACRAARSEWNALLSTATAEGTPAEKTTWYTSLYHLFYQPADLSDAGERPFYSNFSLWDTFRAAHPLYTILLPFGTNEDFVASLLEHGRRNGHLPIWTLWGCETQTMIGTHSIPVIVDWFLKTKALGLRSRLDWEEAWRMTKDTLTVVKPARGRKGNWALLDRYGYFPYDAFGSESVSCTLEAAYDDWCAARLAEGLGHARDAAFFDRRAHNWTNVHDLATGFARGRDTKGAFRHDFNPYKLNVGGNGTGAKDFTEGNSWQYTWHVMQHPEELVARLGGRAAFARRLDGLFRQPEQAEGMGSAPDVTGLVGQYAHGNEPSHHTIYLFRYAGRGERMAELVREVCDRFYRPEPDGLCGNDDCGQMSAWYLFSAMGFYPLNPCGGDYVLGAPQLPRMKLVLDNGRTFTVIARNLSRENRYVRSVTLNGKPIEGFLLRHADILRGGELVFEMARVP